MKGLVYPTLLVLFAISVSACAGSTPQPTPAAVNPGDRIGDVLLTQGGAENITYVVTMKCPVDQGTKVKSCVLRVGTKANIAMYFYDDDPSGGKSLDEMWSGLTQEMVIEGRPVNLQAFGYVDLAHPGLGTLRIPNVVVVAGRPGNITVRHTGVFDGDPFAYDVELSFTETGA